MFKVQSLVCRRGGRTVFRDVSFELSAGDVMLVTGANGIGKSSLLRMLAGLLPAGDNSLFWCGRRVAEDPEVYRQNLRYIGHQDAVKPELTVAEMLDYWRTLSGLNGVALATNDPFNLYALRDKPVRFLSAGQKRRLALSRLFLNDAPLWLLDEPQTALDKQGQDFLLASITLHRAKGGMAVIATHLDINLPEVKHYEMKGLSV